MKTICIYSIRNIIDDKRYIGQTIDFSQRVWQHRTALKNNKYSKTHLQNAYNKYGADNFIFEIVETVNNVDMLTERENYWIDYYNPNTYNSRVGADSNAGIKYGPMSLERKQHLSKVKRSQNYKQSSDHIHKRTAFRKISVVQIDMETDKVIKVWPSATDVDNELGIKRSRISEVCKGKAKTAGGYKWKYA